MVYFLLSVASRPRSIKVYSLSPNQAREASHTVIDNISYSLECCWNVPSWKSTRACGRPSLGVNEQIVLPTVVAHKHEEFARVSCVRGRGPRFSARGTADLSVSRCFRFSQRVLDVQRFNGYLRACHAQSLVMTTGMLGRRKKNVNSWLSPHTTRKQQPGRAEQAR